MPGSDGKAQGLHREAEGRLIGCYNHWVATERLVANRFSPTIIVQVRSTGSAMDFAQRRMALESSLKKYLEIHEKVDETMKRAIAEMPLGR